MLRDHASAAILPVSDLGRAKAFYRDVLGLEPEGEMGGEVATFRSGGTRLVIYRSDFAGTNKGNAVVWDVGDEIEAIAATLKARGAVFEHYPEMGAEFDGAVHRAGGMRLVWLKDPDGNILHINDI